MCQAAKSTTTNRRGVAFLLFTTVEAVSRNLLTAAVLERPTPPAIDYNEIRSTAEKRGDK
jgi:hypothetical protein